MKRVMLMVARAQGQKAGRELRATARKVVVVVLWGPSMSAEAVVPAVRLRLGGAAVGRMKERRARRMKMR
jgi:hypothetical protein